MMYQAQVAVADVMGDADLEMIGKKLNAAPLYWQ